MKNFILIIVFMFCISSHNQQNTKAQSMHNLLSQSNIIDTIITKEFLLTIDGVKGKFQYHLNVDGWEKPVSWEIILFVNNNILFSESQIDTAIDKFFHDPGYVSNCSDYLGCKKRWYLDGITKINIDTLRLDDVRRNDLIEASKEMIKYFPEYCSKAKLPANLLLSSFWAENSKNDIIMFSFELAPEGRETPSFAYCQSKGIIIPIYSP